MIRQEIIIADIYNKNQVSWALSYCIYCKHSAPLLLAFENLWYHIVNRCFKSPPAHFKPSLSQHTFCRCHRFYSQFYPPHIKSPSHLFHLNREVCSINAVDLSFWKRFDWYGTIRNSWLFLSIQLLLKVSM